VGYLESVLVQIQKPARVENQRNLKPAQLETSATENQRLEKPAQLTRKTTAVPPQTTKANQ
jgi:hypothetical protein